MNNSLNEGVDLPDAALESVTHVPVESGDVLSEVEKLQVESKMKM